MASSQQMVSAYLESVIEQLTGVDKAVPDHEGDYAVEVGGARFWARVDGNDPAIVRVYSTVLVGLEPTSELYEALNDINTRMAFLRAFTVHGTVLFEHEHLGMSMDAEEFANSIRTIASASDFFGPQLHQQFGGEQKFQESKTEDYQAPEVDHPGYL